MADIILDTLLDALKLVPFLYLTFFIMELIEHNFSEKSSVIIEKAGKFGPVWGSLLGAFPQCGFSAGATNLYARKIITVGTLMAIYLSTSDEMLPILISRRVAPLVILKIVGLKVIIGVVFGFLIDLFFKRKNDGSENDIHDFCEKEHCHCEDKLWVSTLKHTLNILFFIAVITLILNSAIYFLGEESIKKLFLQSSIFGPFLASLVGLIPNCGASVVLTELYLAGTISFGSTMAG
ncbi:MAG: putative manganese transporter, partial [Oscillospiraceae bacterium]